MVPCTFTTAHEADCSRTECIEILPDHATDNELRLGSERETIGEYTIYVQQLLGDQRPGTLKMKASVEKWRSLAQQEIDRIQVPLPVEHVLAIMQRESNGRVGIVNQSSGASGLMQVMPIALREYNSKNGTNYTMSNLRGDDRNSAEIQIRVGTWILKSFVKGAYKYLKRKLGEVPLDDLIRVADTFYAAGPGAARRRLDQLHRPTWAAIKQRFPDWDRIRPAELVWERANAGGAQWNLPAIDQWLEGGIIDEVTETKHGAMIGILIIALAMALFSKGKK